MNNLFEEIPNSLPKELVEVLAENSDVRIERIVSTGHSSPADFWYDQPRHEWVVLLKGEARLLFEDDEESLHMKPGDFLNIAAYQKHRVEWTTPHEPTVWLGVLYGQ
ncbi:MAG: cupin domain-containing protein [Fuerstiella sp.]|nr:cupin domain-containing protein [Fuerstiella sp.]